MAKTGIFYGSATGVTSGVAKEIAKALDVSPENLHDVASSAPSILGDYDLLVLGSSTWGCGELEDDWFDFLDGAAALDLKGKKIALFGCGDQTMSDTFCNAVGIIYKKLKDTGAEFIAPFPASCYDYSHSEADMGDGVCAGLLLDNVNNPELSPGRIAEWTEIVKKMS